MDTAAGIIVSILSAVLSGGLFGFLGAYLALRANRPIVTAEADRTTAEAENKRAETRGKDTANAELIIGLYEKRDADREKRMAYLEVRQELREAAQEKKDEEAAAREKGFVAKIDDLLELGAFQKDLNTRLEAVVIALKGEVVALRGQLELLGYSPSPAATEKAADVKAAESK